MRPIIGYAYLIAFIFGLGIFVAGNIIGSGMFCGGQCAFEQNSWSITYEIGLALLLAGSIAGIMSRANPSGVKDTFLVVAAAPFVAVTGLLVMFLSVAVLGQGSPFY
jgi:hypothetical protein